jgi:signal recognition particle subunit SRP72
MQSEDRVKALNDAIKRSDHQEIYDCAKLLLKESPEDLDYQQCFILAAIKLGRPEETTPYFRQPPSQPALQPLYAYHLYDRGEFARTVEYINSLKDNASLRLLLAQAHFRAFDYQQSASIMLALLKDSNLLEEEREEYIINLMATGLNRALTQQELRSFEKACASAERKELLYNYALVLWECGQHRQCLDYLRDFEASLIEGKDNDDLAAVRLLRDFVQWQQGSQPERRLVEDYEKLLGRVANRNVRGVIQNNLLFLRQGHTIEHTHEVLRTFDESLESDSKMTKGQRDLLFLNKLSVLLRKGKFTEAQKLLKELEGRDELSRDASLVKSRYFLLKKCKDPSVGAYIDQVAAHNSQLAYCLRADSLKERGAETELIGDLKSKGRETSHPVIKNYIFSLLIKHSALFEQYSDYLAEMAEATSDPNILRLLLNIYENKQDLQKQQFLLQRLLTLQSKDPQLKVKLARIYLDQQRVEEAEETLRGVEAPEELGDIAYLQFIEKNMHISIKKEEEVKEEITKQPDHAKKRIRKKKRARLPRGMEKFVEGHKGDPERWLPKWQRKGYKKKGKKGAGKTQGLATVGREEKNVYAAGTSTSNREVTREGAKKKR